MSANTLDPAALLQKLPNILPLNQKELRSPQDAIAALVHTVFTVLGFRLTGVDEDESGPTGTFENNVLPNHWNQRGPACIALRYTHEQSSLTFLLNVVKLGKRTLINSVTAQSNKPATTLDIQTDDFTSPAFFPHDLSSSSPPPLVHGFISSNRVIDLVSQLQLTTLQKLIPGLRKEGYSEQRDAGAGPSQSRGPQAPAPARPQPEEPPYQPRRDAFYRPPTNPLEIGRSDLDPFPANPFAPPPLFPNSGDGMFVGPGHPMFSTGTHGRGPGSMGPWGGDGYLPPMGAPPGARFDPVGPGAGFSPLPGRMTPRRGGGPFGGQEPDNDEALPPGYGDMII